MNGTRGRQTRRFVRDAAGGGGARRVTTTRPCRSEARADGRSGNRPSLAFEGSRSTRFTDAGAEPSGPRLSAAPLLNHCGIRSDLLPFTVDRSPYNQGLFLPGTHIPIHSPERLREVRPDLVLILPWNLREEIVEQLSFIREWGGRFILPIPRPIVL